MKHESRPDDPGGHFGAHWEPIVRREVVEFLRKSFRQYPLSWVPESPPGRVYAKLLREIEAIDPPTAAKDVGDAFLGAMAGAALAPLIERAIKAIEKMPPPPKGKKRARSEHLRRVK